MSVLQSANLYGYCAGNPIKYSDKTGNNAVVITVAGILPVVDGPLPIGDIIAIAIVATSVAYDNGLFIQDKNKNKVKISAKDVDWNKSFDKDHIMHGSNKNHEKGWKKLGLDPNDLNSFNAMLRYLKDTVNNADKSRIEYSKNGTMIIHFHKLYNNAVYVWTKLVEIGDTLRLSDGGAFLK